jgi:hypothetical protein
MKKNTFILQTIEPSQVYLVKSSNVLGITSKDPEYMEHYGSGTNNLHVYITNKDTYDRGDWCIDIETEDVFKVAEVKEFSGIVRSDTDTYIYDACAKIVLTTDLKLVADEVAEIDIEFLRLLKGKKLDEIGTVEVKKTPLLSNNGRALYGYKYTAIIPPIEDSKKHLVVLAGKEAMEEEISVRLYNSLNQFNLSLKEAINTEPSKLKEIGFGNRSIIEIQKLIVCHQKNIYSEEDMRKMYDKSCGLIGLGELNDQTENDNRFTELIGKIKNK